MGLETSWVPTVGWGQRCQLVEDEQSHARASGTADIALVLVARFFTLVFWSVSLFPYKGQACWGRGREDHKSLRPVSWTPEFTLSSGQEGDCRPHPNSLGPQSSSPPSPTPVDRCLEPSMGSGGL